MKWYELCIIPLYKGKIVQKSSSMRRLKPKSNDPSSWYPETEAALDSRSFLNSLSGSKESKYQSDDIVSGTACHLLFKCESSKVQCIYVSIQRWFERIPSAESASLWRTGCSATLDASAKCFFPSGADKITRSSLRSQSKHGWTPTGRIMAFLFNIFKYI